MDPLSRHLDDGCERYDFQDFLAYQIVNDLRNIFLLWNETHIRPKRPIFKLILLIYQHNKCEIQALCRYKKNKISTVVSSKFIRPFRIYLQV